MSILLIQSAYPHGGRRQVYLPAGVLNIASRLMAIGKEVRVLDLNLDRLSTIDLDGVELVGFSLIGKPYIPGTLASIQEIRKRYAGPITVGGPAVAEMDSSIFERLFGGGIIQADANGLAQMFPGLPSEYDTNMVAALRALSPERRRSYLTREFGLWLSQGCLMGCAFCDALQKRAERYRSMESLREEVTYICDELVVFGHKTFEAYLSNLDGFQTPKSLDFSVGMIAQIAAERGIGVRLRCLSTLPYFCKAVKKDSKLLARLYKNGLRIVAFGADGGDPRVWEREHKEQNTLEFLKFALEACLASPIQPEMLMVIGFSKDDSLAMSAALTQSLYWAWRGVVVRPYLGKPILKMMNAEEQEKYFDDPRRLYNLDFAALGSSDTHPDPKQRHMVNATYLAVITLLTPFGRNTTFPVMPMQGGRVRRFAAHVVNRLMPVDR